MANQHRQEDGTRPGVVAEWFTRSLVSLGMPNPDPFVCLVLPIEVDKADDVDSVLRDFVIWIEHHAIRQWTVDDRGKLKKEFCSSVEEYLSELDCPDEYRTCRRGSGKTSWRDDPHTRIRVVFWLVSCAVSEVYSDKVDLVEEAANNITSNGDKGEALLSCIHKDSFPLGFSTNSPAVDGISSALRMKYLMNLRDMQNKVNLSTAKMQQLTVNEEGSAAATYL